MAYISNRTSYRADLVRELTKRVRAASIFLSAQIKADISQPGTLRYQPVGKNGKKRKSYKTIYNFTHSRPGNPPYKQTGLLRQSIGYEVEGLIGRVGSNIRRPAYPLYLELGTRKMAARPYLRAALIKYRVHLVQLLTKPITGGQLPGIHSNQFRSGHFGRGAASAGWS